MSFLKCTPAVYVIGKEYEISVTTNENGLIWAEIAGEKYYEENFGALRTERAYAKIRVPQSELDKAKAYTLCYRKSIDRKAYWSVLGDKESQTFSFRPLEKTEDIHIYHVADVHYLFERAQKVAGFFGNDLDLLIVNGDIGEVETENDYFAVCKLVGDISRGEVPVLMVRGNHDTRGHLAERFSDYFPCEKGRLYFDFEVGPLAGVALDCGEDKTDDHREYGGVNDFAAYRRAETKFLQGLELPKDKLLFAVSHIAPCQTTLNKGNVFDIDQDVYRAWNEQLNRLGIKFMISGHMHKAYALQCRDEACTADNNDYPLFVASVFQRDPFYYCGGAFVVEKDGMRVMITDHEHQICQEYRLDFATKRVETIK